MQHAAAVQMHSVPASTNTAQELVQACVSLACIFCGLHLQGNSEKESMKGTIDRQKVDSGQGMDSRQTGIDTTQRDTESADGMTLAVSLC